MNDGKVQGAAMCGKCDQPVRENYFGTWCACRPATGANEDEREMKEMDRAWGVYTYQGNKYKGMSNET